MRWFKEDAADFGARLESSINSASEKIDGHIKAMSVEINNHRTLTKSDIESLIDYASERFGSALDVRIDCAKRELSELVTVKLTEVRQELTAAACEQKQVAIRNAAIAVGAALVIGFVSLAYRQLLHGEINLLAVFRVIFAAAGAGQIVWLTMRYVRRFFVMNETQRSVMWTVAGYLNFLRPKGAIGHALVFMVVCVGWLVLMFWGHLPERIL